MDMEEATKHVGDLQYQNIAVIEKGLNTRTMEMATGKWKTESNVVNRENNECKLKKIMILSGCFV